MRLLLGFILLSTAYLGLGSMSAIGVPIRIISGVNYQINFEDSKDLIYVLPINYDAEEGGLGFLSGQERLQQHEVPGLIKIQRLGTALLSRSGQAGKFYASISLSGLLPSRCHRLAVELKRDSNEEIERLSLRLYSAIARERICVREATDVKAAFVVPEPLALGKPVEVWVNFEPVIIYNIDSNGGTVTAYTLQREWRITRLNEIIGQQRWNNRWMREWVEGRPLEKRQ